MRGWSWRLVGDLFWRWWLPELTIIEAKRKLLKEEKRLAR